MRVDPSKPLKHKRLTLDHAYIFHQTVLLLYELKKTQN